MAIRSYSVRLVETAAYVMLIEAESPEEAEQIAKEDFRQCDNINDFFSHVVEDVYADAIVDVTKNEGTAA